ncbi:MAG: hypothetical protein H6817_02195 [Phycisphaerales bacterium]|nr:hypothetical protein [Phycisphaerales bacterium]
MMSNGISSLAWQRVQSCALAIVGACLATGCAEQPVGACCGVDDACSVLSADVCALAGGVYQGDNTDCSTNAICADEIVVFRYSGGECPIELTIKDGSGDTVACDVPRSQLFDADSPLDGSQADSANDGLGTFPSGDDVNDRGMLVRLGDFTVDTNGPQPNLAIVQLDIVVPPYAGIRRTLRGTIKRSAGFRLSADAQAVVDSGERNYHAEQVRKIGKDDAAAMGGVDPLAGQRSDRLYRTTSRKDNTDYAALADGSRYLAEFTESIGEIAIDSPAPGEFLTIYLVFSSDAFDALGEFISDIEITLAKEPVEGSPSLGDVSSNALVIEDVYDVGPVAVVDYTDGAFVPNSVDLTLADSANAQNAVWISNSSASAIMLMVPGHPETRLPPNRQVAFNDLVDGQIIGSNGEAATLDIVADNQMVACCIDDACSEEFASADDCVDAGGVAFVDTLCADAQCTPPGDPWENAPGIYTLQGDCPGNGQAVTLSRIDGELILLGLPENEDLMLSINDETASADGVHAFGEGGYTLTLTVIGAGVEMTLLDADMSAVCTSTLAGLQ